LLLLISLLYLTEAAGAGDPRGARQMIRFHVIHMNFSLNIVLQFLVMFKIFMFIFLLLLLVVVRLLILLVIVRHGIVMM